MESLVVRLPRRPPILVLALAICLSACGPALQRGAAAGASDVAKATPPPDENAIVEVLAEAGVAVYDTPSATEPVSDPSAPASPLRLLRSQVAAMTREVATGGGVGADTIDELLPMPADTVPFTYVLAGYVATADTPGGRLSRDLMADQDLVDVGSLFFPTVVLALFVGEATAAVGTSAAGNPPGSGQLVASLDGRPPPNPPAAAATGICGSFTEFLTSTLAKVAGAIAGLAPEIPFLRAAITWALTEGIGLGLAAAKALIEQIPFIEAIRKAIGGLALAVTVVASLRPWTATIVAVPALAHYSVAPSRSMAKAVATVNDGPGDLFAPEVRECADVLGITLARGGSTGSVTGWRIVTGARHIKSANGHDGRIDDARQTTFNLEMQHETEAIHAEPIIANGLVVVRVTIGRQDVAEVRKFIDEAITSQLPEAVYEALTGLFGDPLSRLAALTDVSAQGRLVAEYHLSREESAPPSPRESLVPSPRDSVPPSLDPSEEFCGRYRAMLTWWWHEAQVPAGSKPWAAEILRHLTEMRRYAPSHLVGAVDVHIGLYTANATYTGPELVLHAAPWAEQMPGAVKALDTFCGIRSGEFGRP